MDKQKYIVTRDNPISLFANNAEVQISKGEAIELTKNEAAPWLRDGWVVLESEAKTEVVSPAATKRGRKK